MITFLFKNSFAGRSYYPAVFVSRRTGLIPYYRRPVSYLTLSLLMLGVRANDHDFAVSANDLALFAHRLY